MLPTNTEEERAKTSPDSSQAPIESETTPVAEQDLEQPQTAVQSDEQDPAGQPASPVTGTDDAPEASQTVSGGASAPAYSDEEANQRANKDQDFEKSMQQLKQAQIKAQEFVKSNGGNYFLVSLL